MKKIQNISALIIIVLLVSCATSDNEIDPFKGILNPEKGSLSAKVNGQDFSTAYPFVTAEIAGDIPFMALAVAGVRTNATDTTGIVLAFFVSTDFVSTADNQEFKGDNLPFNFHFTGAYTSNVHTADRINASSTETDIALATITMIDTVNKKVSGTFSFTAKDPDTDISYQVTDGKFENIEY